jgi:hypothetical protein
METSRRNILMTATAVIALPVVSNMSGCPNIDVIGTLAAFYQRVQQAVATACEAAGKFVPTIDAIMAQTAVFIGAALNDANLPKAVAIVQQIIDSLAKQCPVPAPAGAPAAARPTMTVDGKQVPVFY